MVGLVSSATAPAAPAPAEQSGGQPQVTNPLLAQIEQGVESKIKPESAQMYHGIVAASMKLAFDPSTHSNLQKGLSSSPDMVKNISLICAGIVGTVYEQTKQDINKFLPVAVPAALTLMCNIMSYAEQSQMIQLNPDNVAQCASSTSSAVLNKFGINKDKVAQVVKAGQNTNAATPPGPQPTAGV